MKINLDNIKWPRVHFGGIMNCFIVYRAWESLTIAASLIAISFSGTPYEGVRPYDWYSYVFGAGVLYLLFMVGIFFIDDFFKEF